MQSNDSDDAIDPLRAEVRGWLDEHWDASARKPAHDFGIGWRRLVVDAGWAAPRWPEQWGGRGLSDDDALVVEEEFNRVGAPGCGQDRSHVSANTLLTFGTDTLKHEALFRLIAEEITTCLLYSEPGAGSDLAAVRTRADWNGEHWVIKGHKIWTSGARTAEYGLLLARTDWDRPKHKGLSFFFVPMKQPGIDIKPIHQITGDSHFNEVFLDDVVVPASNLLGELNEGWKVLLVGLAYERLIMGEGIGERKQGSSKDDHNRADLISMARDAGLLKDSVFRRDLAQVLAYRQLNELNVARAKMELGRDKSSPLMSMSKLAMSRILHEEARIMTKMLGAASLLDGEPHEAAADVNYRAANAYMTSIGGGTDQIQRNIIGEQVLGLPREQEADRHIPFRDSRSVTG
ncbi:MAG: acyl-CoA dehydrogenase family protein [Gammaproteobacteria bacterium]|nr:acyl-CoA dehydrogenase family protein [Gammaproteobacteria bacterium]